MCWLNVLNSIYFFRMFPVTFRNFSLKEVGNFDVNALKINKS